MQQKHLFFNAYHPLFLVLDCQNLGRILQIKVVIMQVKLPTLFIFIMFFLNRMNWRFPQYGGLLTLLGHSIQYWLWPKLADGDFKSLTFVIRFGS